MENPIMIEGKYYQCTGTVVDNVDKRGDILLGEWFLFMLAVLIIMVCVSVILHIMDLYKGKI